MKKTNSFLIIFISCLFIQEAFATEDTIYIGTGGTSGVYYPAGGAICHIVNKNRNNKLRCSVESTGGSAYNINYIRTGDLEFGITQSDVQVDAISGLAQFKESKFSNLRSVFSLHPEPVHFMVRADSEISKLEDLEGKRVNIGSPYSGNRAIIDLIMKEKSWTKKSFSSTLELNSSDQAKALCNDKLDATIWVSGLPNYSAIEATKTCDVEIVSLDSFFSKELSLQNSTFSEIIIPAGMYNGNPTKIKTFGPTATLVTSKDVSEEIVYKLTKEIFENIETFKKLHPALYNIDITEMPIKHLRAPVHRGAIKYYKEKGLNYYNKEAL